MIVKGKSLQEFLFNAAVLQGSILSPDLILSINYTDDVINKIAIYTDDATVCSK